jgi:hypothetical protein
MAISANTLINSITKAVGTTAKQLKAIPRYCKMNPQFYSKGQDFSFTFDVIKQEEVKFNVEFTKQWIQSGLNITDHIKFPQGISIKIEAIVFAVPVASGGFISGGAAATNVLKFSLDKAIAAGFIPQSVFGNEINNFLLGSVGSFDTKLFENFLGASQRASRAFNLLLQATINATNFSVGTGMGVFNNIYISSISEVQNHANQRDLVVSLEMTQLLIADQILGGATSNAFIASQNLSNPYNYLSQTASSVSSAALAPIKEASDSILQWF